MKAAYKRKLAAVRAGQVLKGPCRGCDAEGQERLDNDELCGRWCDKCFKDRMNEVCEKCGAQYKQHNTQLSIIYYHEAGWAIGSPTRLPCRLAVDDEVVIRSERYKILEVIIKPHSENTALVLCKPLDEIGRTGNSEHRNEE